MAATLNAQLKGVLDAQFTARGEMTNIDDAQGQAPIVDPTKRSIHVPFVKDGNNAYTTDSLITITSLLNQWNVYTKDHTDGQNTGLLTGFTGDGQQTNDLNPYLFAVIFGSAQIAHDALTAIAAVNVVPNNFAPELQALINRTKFETVANPAGAAAVNPTPYLGGWSGLLNSIATLHPAARKSCPAGEMYAAAANADPAPSANPSPPIPPADLIRYAFGLLYKIKVVLGTDWPETHKQLSKGGRNSKNNKRNKYTHRKKQYSQRRYKK